MAAENWTGHFESPSPGGGASGLPLAGEVVAVEFRIDLSHHGIFVAGWVAGAFGGFERLPAGFGFESAALAAGNAGATGTRDDPGAGRGPSAGRWAWP